jgi:hypothetical protein
LILSSLVGSFALATTNMSVDKSETVFMHHIKDCPPVPTSGYGVYCPEGNEPNCPNHCTKAEPRYCRSGGSMVQCGWVCVFDPFAGGI